ncbi:MAG: hypothetical protein EXR98_02720 [Gemmataceae bacterium]|nr:hypothetical protein [Gemmataceae bacterium]
MNRPQQSLQPNCPVAFALVFANGKDPVHRYLLNLRNDGFWPDVVIADGANLYPNVLNEITPQ